MFLLMSATLQKVRQVSAHRFGEGRVQPVVHGQIPAGHQGV